MVLADVPDTQWIARNLSRVCDVRCEHPVGIDLFVIEEAVSRLEFSGVHLA
jgi:hypothetical protein